MRVAAKIAIGSAVLTVGLGASAIIYFYERPMSTLAGLSRFGLRRAGLVESTAATPIGDVGFWRGGEGPAVVLLHGAGDQAGTWAGMARSLMAHYTVVAIDAPGHWESDPRSGPLDFGTIYRGIEAVVDAQAPKPAVVVGNSMGGWMGLLLAHRHPDWVSRLVLINSGGQSLSGPPLNLMPASREEARKMLAILRDASSPMIPDFMLDDIVRSGRHGPISRIYEGAATIGEYVLDEKLKEIGTPADLLWGESDRFLDVAYAERLAAALPRSRLTLIPKCGHVPQLECPEKLAEALMNILQSEPPALAPIVP